MGRSIKGIESGVKEQVLLGATGTGKTFTMANVIQRTNKQTLILAHNKTLAGQLYAEMKELFPNNHVCYFVSYYDYYQPEAYVPSTDTYIEKDSSINDEIDELRHEATSSLLTYKDTIVVASVSCIYGIGEVEEYQNKMLTLSIGDEDERYISLTEEISKSQDMIAADRKKAKDAYLKAIEACNQNDKFLANKKRRVYNDHIREMAHLKSEHARNNVLLENERALLFSQYKAHGGDMEIIKSLYNDNKKMREENKNGEQQ